STQLFQQLLQFLQKKGYQPRDSDIGFDEFMKVHSNDHILYIAAKLGDPLGTGEDCVTGGNNYTMCQFTAVMGASDQGDTFEIGGEMEGFDRIWSNVGMKFR